MTEELKDLHQAEWGLQWALTTERGAMKWKQWSQETLSEAFLPGERLITAIGHEPDQSHQEWGT